MNHERKIKLGSTNVKAQKVKIILSKKIQQAYSARAFENKSFAARWFLFRLTHVHFNKSFPLDRSIISMTYIAPLEVIINYSAYRTAVIELNTIFSRPTVVTPVTIPAILGKANVKQLSSVKFKTLSIQMKSIRKISCLLTPVNFEKPCRHFHLLIARGDLDCNITPVPRQIFPKKVFYRASVVRLTVKLPPLSSQR